MISTKAAELKYGKLPDLQRKLEEEGKTHAGERAEKQLAAR